MSIGNAWFGFVGWLGQPYPFYYFKEKIAPAFVALFLFSFFFLYLYEPFTVHRPEHRIHYFWICLLHAGLPTFLAFIYFWVVEKYTRAFAFWTIGKEFLHAGTLLFLIGTSNFLIRDIIYLNPHNWSWGYFMEEIRNTFLIGLLFWSILVPLNYLRLMKLHTNQALPVQPMPMPVPPAPRNVFIKTQVLADNFSLAVGDFVFARADGNYLELFLETEGACKKQIKRLSLKELEVQLQAFPFIFKSHRAYLINLRKVSNVRGNAQGYQLQLHGTVENIPVSRSLLKSFREQIQAL